MRRDSTTSVGNLCQCFTILTVKKYFIVFGRNYMLFNLCSLPLVLLVDTAGKSLSLSFSFPPIKFIHTDAISLNLLFSRLNRPSSQPLFTWKMLDSLNHLCGPFLALTLLQHIFLLLGNPDLDPALQMWPYQCWVKVKNHFPQLASNTFPDADICPL